MKVLWLVNGIMPDPAIHLGMAPSVFGGWLVGALGALRSTDYELVICTASKNEGLVGRYPLESAVYYIVKWIFVGYQRWIQRKCFPNPY